MILDLINDLKIIIMKSIIIMILKDYFIIIYQLIFLNVVIEINFYFFKINGHYQIYLTMSFYLNHFDHNILKIIHLDFQFFF